MTPKVLSEIHWEEKNYYMMASITGKKSGLRCILEAEKLQ